MKTIRDVAKLANVSTATVSHIINKTRSVRKETEQRVLEAVRTLNYQPNILARGMKTRKSNAIALLIQDIKNPYFAEVCLGAESCAQQAGYILYMCNATEDYERSISYLQMLRGHRIDGIFNASAPEVRLHLPSLPTISLEDEDDPEGKRASIHIDTHGGAHLAVEHLYNLGHRRIGFISGPLRQFSRYDTNYNRLEGYRRTIASHGIEFDADLHVEGGYSIESGHEAALALLGREERPTAIFCSNDLMAIGAISAASKMKLAVPQDVSIVGFDNIEMSKYTVPPLTTISFDKFELGRLSIEMLVRLIEDGNSPTPALIPTSLVVRESTSPPQ